MILCCGEALIDMIPVTTAEGDAAFQPHTGGAIFNTAIGLGRLGVPTGFVTGLSTDLFGQQLRRALEASHVETALAISSDRPTTLAFVELHEGHATYTFYDENTAGRCLTPDLAPVLPESACALYLGGISLISEPCAEFYTALAEREAASRVIMLDPNIREGFIGDASRYRARLARLLAVADIVKVSDQDLDWLVPGAASLAEQVAQLAPEGLVIVTRGAEGAAAFVSGAEVADVPAQKASVVDTVGAGDTFNAGVLAGLYRRKRLTKAVLAETPAETLKEVLAFGARVAAVTVSRAGANPPWASELE
jgi:fructokinase